MLTPYSASSSLLLSPPLLKTLLKTLNARRVNPGSINASNRRALPARVQVQDLLVPLMRLVGQDLTLFMMPT